jgi:hypothetical protein
MIFSAEKEENSSNLNSPKQGNKYQNFAKSTDPSGNSA